MLGIGLRQAARGRVNGTTSTRTRHGSLKVDGRARPITVSLGQAYDGRGVKRALQGRPSVVVTVPSRRACDA